MSFDLLKSSDITKKKKEVKIKFDGKDITFYANEITFLQRMNLAITQSSGGDYFKQLVIFSITDENGNNMSEDQANALSDEFMEKFFMAATDVNKAEDEKK